MCERAGAALETIQHVQLQKLQKFCSAGCWCACLPACTVCWLLCCLLPGNKLCVRVVCQGRMGPESSSAVGHVLACRRPALLTDLTIWGAGDWPGSHPVVLCVFCGGDSSGALSWSSIQVGVRTYSNPWRDCDRQTDGKEGAREDDGCTRVVPSTRGCSSPGLS